jgi:hypothetical protein
MFSVNEWLVSEFFAAKVARKCGMAKEKQAKNDSTLSIIVLGVKPRV